MIFLELLITSIFEHLSDLLFSIQTSLSLLYNRSGLEMSYKQKCGRIKLYKSNKGVKKEDSRTSECWGIKWKTLSPRWRFLYYTSYFDIYSTTYVLTTWVPGNFKNDFSLLKKYKHFYNAISKVWVDLFPKWDSRNDRKFNYLSFLSHIFPLFFILGCYAP